MIFFQDPTISHDPYDHDIYTRNDFLKTNGKAKFSILYQSDEYRSCDGWFYFRLKNQDSYSYPIDMIWRQKRSLIESLDDPTPPPAFECNFRKKPFESDHIY